jgi:LuxR family maltose regulon positive regulatory protein
VITTKLFRPGLRQQTVERKRLYDVLRQGQMLPLTLVVAPAGWGKSTAVADWLVRDGVTAGWVSLDGGDNDPMRFWRYLLLAADQAGSAAGASALRRLDAAGSDVLRDVLPAFVNELASASAPLVLVLDDYHLVTSAPVHTSVATLLDRSPAAAQPPAGARGHGRAAGRRPAVQQQRGGGVLQQPARPAAVRARRDQAAGTDRRMGRGTAAGRLAAA